MATEDHSPRPQPQPDDANGPSSDNVNTNTTTTTTQQPPSSSSTDGTQDPAVTASPPLPIRHTATTPGPRAQRFQEMFDLALRHTMTKISLENFASCYPTIAAQAPHVLKQVQRGMVDRLAQLCNQEFAAVQSRYHVVAKLNELEALVSDAEQRRRQQQRGGEGRGGRRKSSRQRSQQQQQQQNKKKKGKEVATTEEGVGNEVEEEEEEEEEKEKEEKDEGVLPPPHLLPAGAVLAAHLAPHLVSQQGQMNARLQNTQAANEALWETIQAQRREVDELLGALEATLRDVDGAAALMEGLPAEELARESRAVEVEMADV